MSPHSNQNSEQALRIELLEKSRNFYKQHFLFLDAFFERPRRPTEASEEALPERRQFKLGCQARRLLLARIRKISSSTSKCHNQPETYRIWTDMLSITP